MANRRWRLAQRPAYRLAQMCRAAGDPACRKEAGRPVFQLASARPRGRGAGPGRAGRRGRGLSACTLGRAAPPTLRPGKAVIAAATASSVMPVSGRAAPAPRRPAALGLRVGCTAARPDVAIPGLRPRPELLPLSSPLPARPPASATLRKIGSERSFI